MLPSCSAGCLILLTVHVYVAAPSHLHPASCAVLLHMSSPLHLTCAASPALLRRRGALPVTPLLVAYLLCRVEWGHRWPLVFWP